MKFNASPAFFKRYRELSEEEVKSVKVALFKLALNRQNFHRMTEKLPGRAGDLGLLRCHLAENIVITLRLEDDFAHLLAIGKPMSKI